MDNYRKFISFLLLLLIFSCSDSTITKRNEHVTLLQKPIVKETNFYAFDSVFLPYMPDTNRNFDNLKDALKYNLNLLKKIDSFEEVLGQEYQDSVELVLKIYQAGIQFNNLQQSIVFRELKKSDKNILNISLLSFFSPFSSENNLSERKEFFKSFSQNIIESEAGKKSWSTLEEYTFNRNIDSSVQNLPDIILKDSMDHLIHFQDIFKTKAEFYILIFGASWCGPCRIEDAQLKSWLHLIDTNRLSIIGLSIDKSKRRWNNYLRQDKLPWNTYLLPDAMDNEIVKRLKFRGVPMNFLINREGLIVVQNTDIRKILDWLAKNTS